MRIGVLGINHKLADLKLRDSFARVCQQRFSSKNSTHGDHIHVLLSTCNRTELYFTSENLALSHSYIINILRRELGDIEETFDQKLYTYFGHDCFNHLARVTAGLDSAIVAETEIQGQVKSAYESTLEDISLPSSMHYLFQKSLKIGKQIRTELPLGRGVPDLEDAILSAGQHMFPKSSDTKILFIGASEINQKILNFLQTKNYTNITLCNRSEAPAREMADKYQIQILEWSNLEAWTQYDWIIFGTKSPRFLISKVACPNELIGEKLIIDLCVPRNVDPKLARHPEITLLNIDQINRTLKFRRKKMNHLLMEAEQMVNQEILKQIDLFEEREEKRVQYLAS